MLDDKQLGEALEKSPAPRVTKEQIDKRIAATTFTRIAETVTICQIVLDNGYSVRGESACVNPANYNQEIGERFAHDNAYNKLWPLFGFLLAEDNFRAAMAPKAEAPAEDKKAA